MHVQIPSTMVNQMVSQQVGGENFLSWNVSVLSLIHSGALLDWGISPARNSIHQKAMEITFR